MRSEALTPVRAGKAIALLLLIALTLLPGCRCEPGGESSKPVDAVLQGETGTDEPRPGGRLVVALQDDGTTLDPHLATDAASMHLAENLYDTLLRYAPDYGEVEPALAAEWQVSADRLRYAFILNERAFFHESGREVRSADVRYSIERIQEKGVRADHFAFLESIRTPDDRTVVFELSRPFAPFLTYLAHPMNAVVDREVVEANGGNLDRADAGSGPFRLVEWQKARHLVLARHAGYFEAGLPYLDELVYRPISDENARITALRTGSVDLVLDVPPKDLPLVQGRKGLVVESEPGTFFEYVGMNTGRAPFDDPRVREAVAWAVSRGVLVELVKFGEAQILEGGPIPENHWAHAGLEIYSRRDPERARALLAEAGHREGFETSMIVGSAFPYQIAAAQVITQQLAEVGIRVDIQQRESGLFFNSLARHEFDTTVVGWVGFVDPDEWLYNLFHSGGKWNQQQYANRRVDELLEEGRLSLDRRRREEIYAQAQQLIATDAPVAFLYVTNRISAWRETVRGFDVHPTATTISLRRTWLAR